MVKGGGEEQAEEEVEAEVVEVPAEEDKEEKEERGTVAVARAGTGGSRCTWERRLSRAHRAQTPSGGQPCPETLSCSAFSERKTKQEGQQTGQNAPRPSQTLPTVVKPHQALLSAGHGGQHRRITLRASTQGRVEPKTSDSMMGDPVGHA